MLRCRIRCESGCRAKSYAPGVTNTEIKVGQTLPYSGPVSAWGAVGRAELAYFKMINERGGIKGRKINLLSLDDGFSPPKTVEQTRKLVERDGVAFIFNSLGPGKPNGTPPACGADYSDLAMEGPVLVPSGVRLRQRGLHSVTRSDRPQVCDRGTVRAGSGARPVHPRRMGAGKIGLLRSTLVEKLQQCRAYVVGDLLRA